MEWLARLGGGKIERGDTSPAIAMEHVGAIIVVFADSFLDFRKCYEVFENQLGIRSHLDRTALDAAQNLDQVIAYLMDANADPSARLAELKRAFADFAAHQVAVFHAVVEGGRAVLDAISPESVFQQADEGAGEGLRVRGSTFLSRLREVWPVLPIVGWSAFARRHEELAQEDRFRKVLFGRKFERAYLAVSGNREKT